MLDPLKTYEVDLEGYKVNIKTLDENTKSILISIKVNQQQYSQSIEFYDFNSYKNAKNTKNQSILFLKLYLQQQLTKLTKPSQNQAVNQNKLFYFTGELHMRKLYKKQKVKQIMLKIKQKQNQQQQVQKRFLIMHFEQTEQMDQILIILPRKLSIHQVISQYQINQIKINLNQQTSSKIFFPHLNASFIPQNKNKND